MELSTKQEKKYREELDKRFRPIFSPYQEAGGIPISLLREKLYDDLEVTAGIPQDRIDLLFRRADTNRDGRMSFEEFMRLMTSGSSNVLTTKQLTSFQKMVRATVSTVVPKNAVKHSVDSYVEAYNCKPPPLFMIIVSLAEIGVFIYYALDLAKAGTPITATSGVAIYSPLIYNPLRRYEAWRYLTYMFIHNGYFHLIFNLIFQLLLGLPLEVVHKWWRVGIVYGLGVVAGSLSHSVVDQHSYLAGASGGCYAILGAHFAIVIMNWEEMQHEWMSGPIKFILSAPVRLVVLFLMGGADTGIAIYERYKTGKSAVGFAAHFGGILAGLLVGIPTLKNLDVKQWERVLFWVALIVYICLVIFAVLWNAFYPDFPAMNWTPCCSMNNTIIPRVLTP
ncbi:rhomboid-related protein 2-like [Lineus longissimus]|uniref:rhomboid-related protein 2-like n=1 Tax=Lineus longissimus TaxID=88925 RepID=UPI002B4CF473